MLDFSCEAELTSWLRWLCNNQYMVSPSNGRGEQGDIGIKRSILEQIFREMRCIHNRLDDFEKRMSSWSPAPAQIPEAHLISLSDHVRKTYVAVASAGECSAVEVSTSTGRCRALESNYLNQLCRMGWLGKRKVSKTTVFHLASARPKFDLPWATPSVEEDLQVDEFRGDVDPPLSKLGALGPEFR